MPSVPADLSIEARWIVPMTLRDRVLENHTLVVRDGRILDILPSCAAGERYAATVALQRPRHLLMPGLVNAHTHAAMSLYRGIDADDPLLSVRIAELERRFVGHEFVRDGVLLALAEMLRSGITCFGDGYHFPDETARTAAEQGVRAHIGMPVAETPTPWAATAAEHLTRALRVRDEYKGHPLISTAFAPHAAHTLSDATFARIAALADELDAGIVIHLHASPAEIGESLARYGARPIERLWNLGLLTPALNAVHMAQATQADIDLARRTGISVSLCPQTDLLLGHGLPPVAALAASAVRLGVASGVRGGAAAVGQNQDIWSDMKLLAQSVHTAREREPALRAWDVLAMATRGGADALGLDADIGSLETEKWADLCCLDLGGPATQPLRSPVTQLVFGGGRDIVSDVWVAGRQLLADGELTRLDWPGVAARAGAWAARLTSGG